ncbi:MAG: DUF4783 domain-containing protein [Paludibacteraceae bacterium]
MKTIKILTFIILITAFIQAAPAQNAGIPNEIVTGLNTGDANKLLAHLNDNVELVIGKQNDVYSKQQAVGIISDFFRKNKVYGFQILHNGNKEAANFIIGTLRTATGNYRLYLLTRKIDGKQLIQQLRIESNE